MNIIFVLIAMTSIWVIGLTIVTQEGMLLYSVRKWANDHSPKEGPTFLDAVIRCPWCMPSLHCIVGYSVCLSTGIIEYDVRIIYLYPIVVCGTSFVCGFIWTIYETILSLKSKLDKEYDHLENVEQLSYFDVTERKKQYQENKNRQSFTKKQLNHER